MTTPQGCEIASREGKRERPPRRPPPARAPAPTPAMATAAPSARARSSRPIRVPKHSTDDAGGGGAESHAAPSKVACPLGDDAGGPGPAPGPPRRGRRLRRPVTFRALEGGRRRRETPAAAAPPQESSRGGVSSGARPTPGISPRVAPERGDGGGESGPALGADEAAGKEEAEEEEAERRREAAVGPRAARKRHFDFWCMEPERFWNSQGYL
ncbi:uncharacterized protein LOC142917444 [Petromyzon marinus]|uniref:uncharacterized protein LOC142917444 n=1 Tax=Petromyzon marinus TaxID=7757 RepID=UPI003F72BC63